ncbi:MAG: hypothetical protein Ta2E_00490 [Mycoplasmoidaceae bacterium]|nr:MAG: hypothetical protein Ta2E_00490 [Mycoplasmoidaceae bacterium]
MFDDKVINGIDKVYEYSDEHFDIDLGKIIFELLVVDNFSEDDII